tara:strand:+ start:941 stop:1204 length:264 start_codon:yes stop_codon:yes gene_type:complete
MATKVRILAQYEENGKAKGGMEFEFKISDAHSMYCSNLEEVFSEILRVTSESWAGDFTYISHELLFQEPIQLDVALPNKVIEEMGVL